MLTCVFLVCRHGPDQHVSTCNLVTTATGWDVPFNQAAAAAAATAAAACAVAGQAAMSVEADAAYEYCGAAGRPNSNATA